MACNPFISRCAALLLLLLAIGNASAQSVFSTGPLVIGITPVETTISQTPTSTRINAENSSSELIARTMAELVPTYIERAFEKALERRVLIVRVPEANPNEAFSDPLLSAVISSQVFGMGDLGVRVTARA